MICLSLAANCKISETAFRNQSSFTAKYLCCKTHVKAIVETMSPEEMHNRILFL